MARPPDVIHDLVAPVFLKRFAHPCRDVVENFVPAHTFPFSFAPLSHPLQGITNALGIGYLIKCRRTFGAVASAAAGMFGIAFESADAQRFLIDETQQTAGRLAVKTDRRNNLITFLDFSAANGPYRIPPNRPTFPRVDSWLTRRALRVAELSRMKRLPGLDIFISFWSQVNSVEDPSLRSG